MFLIVALIDAESSLSSPREILVERFSLPGIGAINFVVHEALGGGIMVSNRIDSVAKTMAQQLLAFPIPVSPVLASTL
jgi:hypothetical protein